jgi:hypothetical protein
MGVHSEKLGATIAKFMGLDSSSDVSMVRGMLVDSEPLVLLKSCGEVFESKLDVETRQSFQDQLPETLTKFDIGLSSLCSQVTIALVAIWEASMVKHMDGLQTEHDFLLNLIREFLSLPMMEQAGVHDGPCKQSDFHAMVFCKNWLLAFECVIPSVVAGNTSNVALSDLRDVAALLSAWAALDGVRSTPMRQIFRDWCARSVEPEVIAFQSLLPIETILCLHFVLCFCGCSLRFVELCFGRSINILHAVCL